MTDDIDLEEELKNIIEDLDRQLEVLSVDNNFHNAIIDIISNNPNSKELVQFIVSINDKLETKQEIFKEVFSDSLRTLIIKKINIFKEISKELKRIEEENCKGKNKTKEIKSIIQNGTNIVTNNVKENKKTYLFIFFGILLLIAFLVFPDKFILILQMYLTSKGV